MVSSIQSSTAAARNAAADPSQVGATQDRFLKLLIAQMQHQDPLNPMDNAQVTSQMAQLSTVSGIDKLNSTVQALSASMLAARSLQAVGMIGHTVLAPGNALQLAAGGGDAALELAQPADAVRVTILDAAGNPLRVLQLGAQDAGVMHFHWDGRTDSGAQAAQGRYQFTVEAMLGSQPVQAAPLAYGRVDSVAQSSGAVSLMVQGVGALNLNDIRQIL